jgi:hypothetical protein
VANETIDLRVVAGTALIIGGVALLNVRRQLRWLARTRQTTEVEAEPSS